MQNLRRPTAKETLPDYDRSIIKSRTSQKERPHASGRKVAQLGEQKNQSCPPLNVFSDIPVDSEYTKLMRAAADNLGVSLVEYLGSMKEYPMAEPCKYKYKHGEPLVRPEEVRNLPTKMRRLHQWYMEEAKKGTNYLILGINDEHFLRGKDEIHIEFEELFQLFNQRHPRVICRYSH